MKGLKSRREPDKPMTKDEVRWRLVGAGVRFGIVLLVAGVAALLILGTR